MLSTLKLLWYVIFPVLFLSGFYSSIDFNGLQLRSLVSESLALYLYRAQTARSLVSFFPPSESLKYWNLNFFFLHWYIILIGINLEAFRYLSNHLQFHWCVMTLYFDNWQLHFIACHPTDVKKVQIWLKLYFRVKENSQTIPSLATVKGKRVLEQENIIPYS